jgi:endonuclease YncB( thermonuclease family)
MRGWIAGLVLILASPVWAAECIVSDGDTLTLRGTKYRLDGIDAPEFNQVCLDEKGQEWNCGLAARDALFKLIETCAVQCEDKGPDKVHRDRRIGICTFESMELNKWLVREGWAVNFEPYAKGRFLRDQADAAKNRRGIWKGCFAVPTDWRHWKKDAPLMGSACASDAASRIFDCRILNDAVIEFGGQKRQGVGWFLTGTIDRVTGDVTVLLTKLIEGVPQRETQSYALNCERAQRKF